MYAAFRHDSCEDEMRANVSTFTWLSRWYEAKKNSTFLMDKKSTYEALE
jgi:hypothetical protein